MVALPDRLQQLLHSYRIDSPDAEKIRTVIDGFQDPLSAEQLIALVNLFGLWQILVMPRHSRDDDKSFFHRATIGIGLFFVAQKEVPSARALLNQISLTIQISEKEYFPFSATKYLIEAFVQAKDFESAQRIVNNSSGRFRFLCTITLAAAFYKIGETKQAKKIALLAEDLLPWSEMGVDGPAYLCQVLIDAGEIEQARKYLEKSAVIIEQNEKSGDEYAYQDWGRICFGYAQIGDVEQMWKASEKCDTDGLANAIEELIQRGRLADAEKTIAQMKETSGFYQQSRTLTALARAYHDRGQTPRAKALLQGITQFPESNDIGVSKFRESLENLRYLPATYQYIDDVDGSQKSLDDLERLMMDYETELERLAPDVIIAHETGKYVQSVIEAGDLARAKNVFESALKRFLERAPQRFRPALFDSSRLMLCYAFAEHGQYAEAIKLLLDDSLNFAIFRIAIWAPNADPAEFASWKVVIREIVSIASLVDSEWKPIAALLTS